LASASEILRSAADLVSGDRNVQHGDKEICLSNIAEIWTAYLRIRKEPAAPLTGIDVASMMALLRLARTQTGAPNVDDWLDGAGYIALAGELASS
jgi:hypothetical protein